MNQDKQPEPLELIVDDFRAQYALATPGKWTKGCTTHETVSEYGGKPPYKVADFRHANDAAFCDLAHAHVPRLLDELSRQHARIAELEAELAAVQQGVQQALYTVIGESGCALPQYSANTEQGVIHNVLAVARNEGYKGDGITRLMELGWKVRPVYTHPTQQGLDSKLLSLDSDLLVEARRALWRLSRDYEDGELRLRAQEHLERIDERRCVGRENIFNSHADIAAQAKQGERDHGIN